MVAIHRWKFIFLYGNRCDSLLFDIFAGELQTR